MRHVTGLANASGLRSTSKALSSVQVPISGTEVSEQIEIKAVNILFPSVPAGAEAEVRLQVLKSHEPYAPFRLYKDAHKLIRYHALFFLIHLDGGAF
jgi:hypothetical protein